MLLKAGSLLLPSCKYVICTWLRNDTQGTAALYIWHKGELSYVYKVISQRHHIPRRNNNMKIIESYFPNQSPKMDFISVRDRVHPKSHVVKQAALVRQNAH